MGLGLVDTYLAYKFIKMLATPWKKTDAYKLGIIDKKGKRIKSEEADDAVKKSGSKYTNVHKLVFNIKRLISKVPGGKSRLGGAAAALWLLKEESKKMGVENENLIEEVFTQYLKDNGYEYQNDINESFNKLDLTLPEGKYILYGDIIDIKEKRESFDSILGVPLFRLGETVFSNYDIDRIQKDTMKNFKEFREGSSINETTLLGKSIQMGERKGRIVVVVSVGETSRYDTVYKVKFQDGTKVEMHDSQIRPFLVKEEHGAGEEGTDELDDTYREDTPGELDEDSPTNAVGGGMSPHFGGEGGVQGTDPILGKKKKRKKFAGAEVFELCSDDYHSCIHGRKRYERWNKKMNMENIDNQEIRSYAHKNPGKPIVVQDKTTGIMSYLIHGDGK